MNEKVDNIKKSCGIFLGTQLGFRTFPVLAISLIPNLLKIVWTATIFPGSPVTCNIYHGMTH